MPHRTTNLPDGAYSVVNVYSQVIYLQREREWEVGEEGVKKETGSSMFYLFRFMNFSSADEFFKCKPSPRSRCLLRARLCLSAAWDALAVILTCIKTLLPPLLPTSPVSEPRRRLFLSCIALPKTVVYLASSVSVSASAFSSSVTLCIFTFQCKTAP